MGKFFFDSSAIIKRYFSESGSDKVREIIKRGELIVVSRLAYVEITATVSRRVREGDLSVEDGDRVFRRLDKDFGSRFGIAELDSGTITRAADLARAHPLKAGDAMHLACAVGEVNPGSSISAITFVSSDKQLNHAARREGFNVVDPQAE